MPFFRPPIIGLSSAGLIGFHINGQVDGDSEVRSHVGNPKNNPGGTGTQPGDAPVEPSSLFIAHVFTDPDGALIVTRGGLGAVEVLIVAGGGSGGSTDGLGVGCGGGGAGGLYHAVNQDLPAGTYPIAVGRGGPPAFTGGAAPVVPGNPGQTSSAFGIVAPAGGFGGGSSATFLRQGGPGGSGGGGASSDDFPPGPPDAHNGGGGAIPYGFSGGVGGDGTQGNWSGAGGGGAGNPGADASVGGGSGGLGQAYTIATADGVPVTYATGGTAQPRTFTGPRPDGGENTGNGGWSGADFACLGGAGGSGIVVVKYARASGIIATGGTIVESDVESPVSHAVTNLVSTVNPDRTVTLTWDDFPVAPDGYTVGRDGLLLTGDVPQGTEIYRDTFTPGVTVLFKDNFVTGNLAHEDGTVRYNSDGEKGMTRNVTVRAIPAELPAPPAGASANVLQFNMGASTNDSELGFTGLNNEIEVYIDYDIYMPDGTEGPWPKFVVLGTLNDKFFRLWGGGDGIPSGYDFVYDGNHPDTTRYGNKVGASLYGNAGHTDGSVGIEFMWSGDTSVPPSQYGEGQVGSDPDGDPDSAPVHVSLVNDANRGRWVRIRFHVVQPSHTSGDGVMQMWVDDDMIFDKTLLNNGNVWDAIDTVGYTTGYIFGFANNGYATDQVAFQSFLAITTGGWVR